MPSDSVTRAFNQLHTVNKPDGSDNDYEQLKRQQREQEVQELLADNAAPVTTERCIPWILEAWGQSNYFKLLGLPAVEVNALGKPTWECSAGDVSKAYRKLSALVHPDKAATAAHPDGRLAFERLNEAARILKDPAKRADEVAKRVDEARRRRALQEASATVSDRVALNASRNSEAQQLRQKESSDLSAAMKKQAEERRASAAHKRTLREQAEARAAERSETDANAARAQAEDASAAAGDDSDDENTRRRVRNRKRARVKPAQQQDTAADNSAQPAG